MYVARDQWSQPDAGDALPCFRQGDLVRVTWAAVQVDAPSGKNQLFHVDLRTEIVALLSADCDLVDHERPKRKGVLMSPLRKVPSYIARNAEMLQALKAPTVQPANQLKMPVNLFYFEPIVGSEDLSGDNVIYLEMVSPLTFSVLKLGAKVAELTEDKRQDLRERLKFHFGRHS